MSGDPTGSPQPATFSAQAWAITEALQDAIRHHPFNEALATGTLRPDQFAFYLVQDSRYLLGFSRALAAASTRASDTAAAAFLANSSHTALVVERQLHGRYLDRFDIDPRRIATSPSCLAYSSYLQACALSEPFAVLAAALLPCFWIYQHVGTAINDRTRSQPDHPYRDWIDTYADEAFAESVRTMKDITDRAGATSSSKVRTAMLDAFCRASEYEWMFWDSAWHQEGWVTSKWLPARDNERPSQAPQG